MKLIFVVLILAAGIACGSIGVGMQRERPQTPTGTKDKGPVALGKYVCYDLTLVLGAGGYRYGYKDIDSFNIIAGGLYKRGGSATRGKYNYDPQTNSTRFLSGPYADAGRVGKYEREGKSAEERLKKSQSGEGGTPNIILHKEGDESGDLDWYCSLERR